MMIVDMLLVFIDKKNAVSTIGYEINFVHWVCQKESLCFITTQ